MTRILWKSLACCLIMATWSLVQIAADETISAPVVEFQGVLSRDKIERDEVVTLFLFVNNKSKLPIRLERINLLSDGFVEEKKDFFLPLALSPFGSHQGKISLKGNNAARFGAQKLVISVDYSWPNDKQTVVTTQSVTLPLELMRRFDEEAKGFPGGTAAFLYLLLPVIPAFLSYQVLDGLRKKELKVPEFESKHIVPAFLAAIVISFIVLVASSRDAAINFSDPRVFIGVLFTSLIVGGVIPGTRWLWSSNQMRRWGFSSRDGGVSYLHKALLGPYSPEGFEWVTGTVGEEIWQGFLLSQPNGDPVLGAQITVAPKKDADVAFKDGDLTKPKLLVQLAKTGTITVDRSQSVMRGETQLEQMVVVEGLKDFKRTATDTSKAFVRPIT